MALFDRGWVFSLLLLNALPALAYVRTTSEFSGVPLSWRGTHCVFLRMNKVGSDDVADGSDVAALDRAAGNWHAAIRAAGQCSYMRFVVEPAKEGVAMSYAKVGRNESQVFWIEKGWASDPDHAPSAAALTTVLYLNIPDDPRDGEIVDADVEINGENFTFATAPKNGALDVENVLTHELGHVLGLEHPCYLDPSPPSPHPKDHRGGPIPACRQTADRTILDATMFPSTSFRDIDRRSPTSDDVGAICAIYPADDDPGQCGRPDPGCCAVASAPNPPLSAWFLILLGATAALWRATPWSRRR